MPDGEGVNMEAVAEPKAKAPGLRPVKPPEGVRLYRAEHVAYLLQMSVRSVQRLVAKGMVPYRETPAGQRFTNEDLDAYISRVSRCKGEAPDDSEHRAARARAKGIEVDPKWVNYFRTDAKPRKKRGAAS